MSLLDPQIPKNRRAFDRWRRRQLIGIPITVLVGLVWIMLFLRFADLSNETLARLSLVPLALYGVFLFYTEYHRLRIFRRDLRERRSVSDSTGETAD